VAFGDLDNDGRIDLVISHVNEPVVLLRNEVKVGANHWLGIELMGKDHGNVTGARLELEVEGLPAQTRYAAGGGSFASSSDPRHVFGLGNAKRAGKLTVRWPSGREQSWDGLAVDRYWRLVEGEKDARSAGSKHPAVEEKPLGEWIKDLKSPDDSTRVRAFEAIGRLGPQAKAAAPALLEALGRGGNSASDAGVALWKVDREAFKEIFKGPDERSTVRWEALLSLTNIGTEAKELAPAVLKIAANKYGPNWEHSLWALGSIGAEPTEAVPILKDALQDERAQYARMISAQALGALGEKAKDALPALHMALSDSDSQVRVDAAYAVWQIDRDAAKAVPVLTAALKDEASQNPGARQRAVFRLGHIGPPAKEAFPALLELWKAEKTEYMKGEIAKSLRAIDAKEAERAGAK
jgi:HEAT repeat protein